MAAAKKTNKKTAKLPKAEAHLAAVDPKLGAAIARVVAERGLQRFPVSPARSHFDALARSIVFQQLSGKAAATIHGRFAALFERRLPNAAALLELDDAILRAVGLSRGKLASLRDLSKRVQAREVDLEHVATLEDAELIESLVAVRGIGEWTAQMFLMFRLGRPDVLPKLDLGVRKGVAIAHGLKKIAAPGYVERAGAKWAPYRSLASLYCWRIVDVDGGQA